MVGISIQPKRRPRANSFANKAKDVPRASLNGPSAPSLAPILPQRNYLTKVR